MPPLVSKKKKLIIKVKLIKLFNISIIEDIA